jgi:hypothetical protein
MTDLSKLEVGLKGSAELLVGVEHTAPASAAGAGSALEKRRKRLADARTVLIIALMARLPSCQVWLSGDCGRGGRAARTRAIAAATHEARRKAELVRKHNAISCRDDRSCIPAEADRE